MDDPRRILLVRLSHLGDVVQALPCFHALRARFPEARIGWAVEPRFAGLLDTMTGLDRVVLFERSGGWRAWPRLRRELHRFAPDLTVDVQGNWKSALVARASGARQRFAPAREQWREPSAAWLATAFAAPAAPPPEATVPHAQDVVLHVTRELCGPFEVRRDPALSKDELTAARVRLAEAAPNADEPLALVQVSDPKDVRTATDACLIDAAARLGERGIRVVFTAAAEDAERARALATAVARACGVAPGLSCDRVPVRAFAAWLAAAAERNAVLVSGDTGPLHLAAAVGLVCVCLSGPFDWRRSGPWPPPPAVASARGPGAHRVLTAAPDLDCRPCNARTCRRPGGRACLERIDGARVADAVAAGLAELRRDQAPSSEPSSSSSSAMRSGTSR